MYYKKITLELIVPMEEADAMIAQLVASLHNMQARYTLFSEPTETVLNEQSESRTSIDCSSDK